MFEKVCTVGVRRCGFQSPGVIIQSYQQKLDDKENEVSAARGELSSKMQQCEKDKQSAADEIVKFE